MTVKDSLTPEEIEKNFNRFCGYLGEKQLGERSKPAIEMVEHLGERLALAPGSSRKDYHNCFPGGLVDHSLRVLSNAAIIAKGFKWNIPLDSMIIGCLFHDLGKVGDLENDLYIDEESDWHREKLGRLYSHNKSIPYMTVPDRGVWLCSQFGLKLSHDEFLAIKLNDGQYFEGNKDYKLKEPMLAICVHHADLIATLQESRNLP